MRDSRFPSGVSANADGMACPLMADSDVSTSFPVMTFHSLIVSSKKPAANVAPLGETATLLAKSPETGKRRTSLPVLESQNLTVPSVPPDARCPLSGAKLTHATKSSCPRSTLRDRRPDTGSQRRIVPSSHAAARLFPSRANATWRIAFCGGRASLFPGNTWTNLPELVSQILSVGECPAAAAATVFPSGANAMEEIGLPSQYLDVPILAIAPGGRGSPYRSAHAHSLAPPIPV